MSIALLSPFTLEVTYVPEAEALFARMETDPPVAYKVAYDAMYRTAGFLDVLAKMDGFYVRCGPDEQSSLLNLAAVNEGTVEGTVTHTPGVGFVSTGSGGVDSGLNLSALTKTLQNDASVWVYIMSMPNGQSSGSDVLRGGIVNSTFRAGLNTSNDKCIARVNDASALAYSVGNGVSKAFVVGNRSGASAKQLYVDGVEVASATTASSARDDANVSLFKVSEGSYVAAGITVSFDGFGGSITEGEAALLKSVADTFLSSDFS